MVCNRATCQLLTSSSCTPAWACATCLRVTTRRGLVQNSHGRPAATSSAPPPASPAPPPASPRLSEDVTCFRQRQRHLSLHWQMLAHVLLFSRLSPASNQLSDHTLTRADISHLVKVSSYLPHLQIEEVTCFRGGGRRPHAFALWRLLTSQDVHVVCWAQVPTKAKLFLKQIVMYLITWGNKILLQVVVLLFRDSTHCAHRNDKVDQADRSGWEEGDMTCIRTE